MEALNMDIEYGSEVIDRNGKLLGTVDYVIRNSWTGEISKFRVRRDFLGSELMLSPEEILEVAEAKIKVDISSDGLTNIN
jgi:sporulation protein YlmC with PRC-barrel domain